MQLNLVKKLETTPPPPPGVCGLLKQIIAGGSSQYEPFFTGNMHPWTTDRVSSTADEERRRREKTSRYKHVPHREKPPQVVAKRNARERRRVQAVNGAFVRLRKAVPIENARGKRISKVKTLQNAIEYIRRLQMLVQEVDYYEMILQPNYDYCSSIEDFFDETCFEDDY